MSADTATFNISCRSSRIDCSSANEATRSRIFERNREDARTKGILLRNEPEIRGNGGSSARRAIPR